MTSIDVKVGDLLASECQTLVNTVNTVGVMGKGIAQLFRDRFPAMYADYRRRCSIEDPDDPDKVRLGEPYLWRPELSLLAPSDPSQLKWIINFPTKDHWRGPSQWEAIVGGLRYLSQRVDDWGVESLAVPPLGCGLGGLEWKVVGPQLYSSLSRLAIPVELYAPWGTPGDQLDEAFLARSEFSPAIAPSTIDWRGVALADACEKVGVESGVALNRTQLMLLWYLMGAIAGQESDRLELRRDGIHDPDFNEALPRLLRNSVLREREDGRQVLFEAGRSLDDAKRSVGETLLTHDADITTAVAAFGRLKGQARVAPAVLHLTRVRTTPVLGTDEIAAVFESVGFRSVNPKTLREIDHVLKVREEFGLATGRTIAD